MVLRVSGGARAQGRRFGLLAESDVPKANSVRGAKSVSRHDPQVADKQAARPALAYFRPR